MANSLTVTEKEHWKSRIEKRIQDSIEQIYLQHSGLKEQVAAEAQRRAADSLGISEPSSRLSKVQSKIGSLEAEQQELRASMIREVVPDGNRYMYHRVEEAVKARANLHRKDVLTETDSGKRVLELEAEQENLLDTVWLATSPKQIKELWSKVDEKLGTAQTELQRDALAIEPIDRE